MNLLIWGDTETRPELRHEVPLSIGDPFLYLEADGRRVVVTNALEDGRIARAAPHIERLLNEQLGRDELIAAGRPPLEIEQELCVRAAERLGIRDAVVPPDFPLAIADRLRAAGVGLTADPEPFTERRRRKSAAEMAGIHRATAAGLDALRAAAAMLREAEIRADKLWRDGERLTSEAVRARIREVCGQARCPAPADIMVKPMGPDPQIGHDPGSGPLPANMPIEIDLWPQDEASGCWSDMTRTFVRGEISSALAELHSLVLTAHERACAALKPGVPGVEVYGIACDVFEAAGHPTARTKAAGDTLREGFFYGLGHGIGLQVHEAPILGRSAVKPLIVGDVIAVEPGTLVSSLGGVRVEDLARGGLPLRHPALPPLAAPEIRVSLRQRRGPGRPALGPRQPGATRAARTGGADRGRPRRDRGRVALARAARRLASSFRAAAGHVEPRQHDRRAVVRRARLAIAARHSAARSLAWAA